MTITSNVTLGGTYTITGNFTVNSGVTVTALSGCILEINAQDITINGTINADSAGHSGGSGGSGGGAGYASSSYCTGGGGGGAGGAAGSGTGGGGAGTNGGNGSHSCQSCGGFLCIGNADGCVGGGGGGGGARGGSYGGLGGVGGYAAVGNSLSNTPCTFCFIGSTCSATGGSGGSGGTGGSTYGTDTGTDIAMGSGGGGAGGGGGGWASGNSGGSGGAGGGGVKLNASRDIIIPGTITANGGNGGSGGLGSGNSADNVRDCTADPYDCCSICSAFCVWDAAGGNGGGAGGGSGGGIYIAAARNTSVTGTLRANGGNGGSAPFNSFSCLDNSRGGGGGGGGRIKIFRNPCGTINISPAEVTYNGGNGGSGPVAGANGAIGTYNIINHPSYSPLVAGTISSAQTICSGGTPAAFTGTASTGGISGSYTYNWFSCTGGGCPTPTSGNPSPGTGWTDRGTNATGFTETSSLTSTTTYVRRTISGVCVEWSNIITVTVVADPSATTPTFTNGTICAGGSTSASSTVSGGTGTASYQWQYWNGSSWNNVVNGTPAGASYTGATSTTLGISGITAVGSHQYRMNVSFTGTGCDPGSSPSATLTVVADPTASTPNFSNTTICAGGSTVASSSTSGGTGTITYQWQYFDGSSWSNVVNGTPAGANYTGATTTSMTISGITATGTYQYRMIANFSGSGCDQAISAGASFTVVSDISISSHPASVSICETGNASLNVSATGGVTPYTYIWQYFDGTNWINATPGTPSGSSYTGLGTNSISIDGLSGGTSFVVYPYRVIVQSSASGCDDAISTTANVTVYKVKTITSSSADMCEGETRSLTATPAGGTFSGTGVSGSTFTAPTPTGASQTYTITYVVTGSACPADTQNITVYRNPTVSNAGADFSSCGLTVTLNGNNPTFGTGTWTTQAGPGTITYANTSQHNTNATASVAGTYTLRWTISNGACPSSQDEVDVTFYNSLSASGTPDTILVCTDSIVNITGSVSGGFGTQTFLWQYYDAGIGNWVAAPGVNNTINYTTQPLSNTSTTVDKIYRFRLQYSRSGCPSPVLSNETYAKVFAVPSLTGTNDECASIIGSNNYDYIYTVGSSIYSPFTVSDYSGGATLMYGPTEAFKIYRIPFGSGNHTFVITDANGCQVFSDIAKSSALPITIPNVTIPGTSNGNCFIKNYDEWVHIKRASNPNQVIASIRDNDVDLGLVNVICYRDSHAVLIPNSGPFCIGAPIMAMRRHFKVTSTTYNDPSIPFVNSLNVPTDVTVRLYFSDADLADLKNAALANDTTGSNCDYDDNIYSINGLYITKYSDYLLSGTEDSIYTNNYPTASYYKVFSPATATATVDSASGFDALFGTSGANIHYAQMDVSEFSEFWLHGSQNGSPLPVEMLYIEARNINNSYIQIRWATAFELNNWKFEVERSTDGVNFAKIGEVIGHGTSTERHDYVYNDKEVVAGIRYYYRLKQIDFDESYEYSPIVSEMLKGEDFFRVSEFIPNPAAHQAKLIINTGKEQEIQVEMHNYLGEIVKKGNTFLNKGSNTITFEFEELAAGTYTTRIVAGNSTYIRRLVIAK